MSDSLGDIRDRDIDNLKHLLKNKKTHVYTSYDLAGASTGEMLRLALLRVGFDLKAMMNLSDEPEVAYEVVQEGMTTLNISIETRQYPDPIDAWREGTYLYKDNEIVAWISPIREGLVADFTIDTTEDRPAIF